MTSIEDRLLRLEAKEEIRDLLLAYCEALDGRDTQGFADLFTSDGEWTGGIGSSRTPAGIKAMLDNLFGQGTGRKLQAHHMIGNMMIKVDADTATARSRWMWVTAAQDGRPVMTRGGRYEDELVREDGTWKFRRRQAINEYSDAMPAAGADA